MNINWSKPYVEVCGLPGAVYEQDGLMFKSDGSPALDTQPIVEEILSQVEEIIPINPLAETKDPEVKSQNPKDLHWKHLKVLVESYGGTWTNKENALEFLKLK